MRLGQSFSKGEIDITCSIFLSLFRGGDPGLLLERAEMLSVARKFLKMQKKLDTQAEDTPRHPS